MKKRHYTRTDVFKELGINRFVLSEINKGLTNGKHYTKHRVTNKYNSKTGLNKTYYTREGLKEIKKKFEQINEVKEQIEQELFKLQHDPKSRTNINVFIRAGAYKYLKSKGFGDLVVAYILNRDRNTIKNLKSIMEYDKNQVIKNAIIEATAKELSTKNLRCEYV